MSENHSETEYWSGYYGRLEAPVLPSQFALFVANEVATGELPAVRTVCDVGCGNGRDALFFLQQGFLLRGLDSSAGAIAACNDRLLQIGEAAAPRARFVQGPADTAASWQAMARDIEGPVLIYARFFFHAIDDEAQTRVLGLARELLGRTGGAFCAEYRTPQDSDATKVTPSHYRRFIDPDSFAREIQASGLNVVWRAEGRGMAKYKGDDAHVARILAVA